MKSHDEFRRTVFEKARLYELRRKARRRRIAGNLCLFGIVFTILTTATLHVYRSFSASNSKGPDKNAAAFDTSGTMTAASTDRPSSTAASTAGTVSGDTQSPVCRTVFSQVSPSYANGGSPGALFIRADAQWEEFLSVYASAYPGLSEFADTVRTQELSASPLIAVLYTGKPGAEAVFSDAHTLEIRIPSGGERKSCLMIVETKTTAHVSVLFRLTE